MIIKWSRSLFHIWNLSERGILFPQTLSHLFSHFIDYLVVDGDEIMYFVQLSDKASAQNKKKKKNKYKKKV